MCFFPLSLVAENLMSMKTYNKIFSNCCRNRVIAELYKYCVVSFKCCGFISQTPDQISFLFTEKELIWSGICCRGPHFQSWFGRWWTAIQSGMVRVGCGGRGEVAWIWPTAPPPSGLHQQTSVVPLNLLLSIWPFTVHSSQRTGSFDTLVVFNQDLVSAKLQAIVHRN